MNSMLWGIVFGLVIGAIDVLIMIPMKEPDKRKKTEAMAGAFLERFMIGFLIPNTEIGTNYVITGLIIGTMLSLPTAIITRVYLPIIVIGAIGGIAVGIASNMLLA